VGRTDFWRLTRRANQGHIDIIADIVAPAPGNRERALHWRRRYPQRQFQMLEPVSLHFPQFIDPLKKNLTRRANQGQINIIAKFHRARAEKSAAGFFVENICIGCAITSKPKLRRLAPCCQTRPISLALRHFSQFSDSPKKEFDTSGKSGLYQHHREN
jgi:hypothetical protein